MNILWISDGKKGHEKQVEILLNEISKTENIVIKKEIKNIKIFFSEKALCVAVVTCRLNFVHRGLEQRFHFFMEGFILSAYIL